MKDIHFAAAAVGAEADMAYAKGFEVVPEE
jgi:hypothetical protein